MSLMPLRFEMTRLDRYVRFDVAGEATLEDLHGFINAVAQRTLDGGDHRALADLRQVQESFKFTDHYAIGELVARRLHHLERLASLVPAPRRTGTSEKVAMAQGTALRVFVDEAAAIAWLDEPKA